MARHKVVLCGQLDIVYLSPDINAISAVGTVGSPFIVRVTLIVILSQVVERFLADIKSHKKPMFSLSSSANFKMTTRLLELYQSVQSGYL